jgi:hypothetical protein
MSESPELLLTLEDHQKAFTEISFFLDIFASTIHNLMGGATSSVGRIAGRQMAKKLPLHFNDPGLEEVLGAVAKHIQAGFDITYACRNGSADVSFKKCSIREVCKNQNITPGESLCKLFHYYFDGIVNELHCRPVKSTLRSTGEVCQICLETR